MIPWDAMNLQGLPLFWCLTCKILRKYNWGSVAQFSLWNLIHTCLIAGNPFPVEYQVTVRNTSQHVVCITSWYFACWLHSLFQQGAIDESSWVRKACTLRRNWKWTTILIRKALKIIDKSMMKAEEYVTWLFNKQALHGRRIIQQSWMVST